MTLLEERLALKCRGCGGEVQLGTEMPGADQTDQTTDIEALQTMLDALGGVYCLDCPGKK